MNQRSAITKINKSGMLLVFPIHNKKEPRSLWGEFFPRTKMRWEWDDSGDNKVADMWHLMKKLSATSEVVYSKWYQGRATFFSRDLFTALLACLTSSTLTRNAREILDLLENDSPLSTKQLKQQADLQGRDNEPAYNRAMKELFSKLLIVAFGEVDDGAFPSLAVGATKLLFEDLWVKSQHINRQEALHTIDKFMPQGSVVRRFLDRLAASSHSGSGS